MKRASDGRLRILGWGIALWVGLSMSPVHAQEETGVIRLGGASHAEPYCPPEPSCPPGTQMAPGWHPRMMPAPRGPVWPVPSYAPPHLQGGPTPFNPNMLPQGPLAPSTRPRTSPGDQDDPVEGLSQAPATTIPTQIPDGDGLGGLSPAFGTQQSGPTAGRLAAAVPPSIGDFFGSTASTPSIVPGNLVNQAVLFQPGGGLLDYYRIVTPLGGGVFNTANDVLLGSDDNGNAVGVITTQTGVIGAAPQAVGPDQLLQQSDGAAFVGDPATLGAVTDPGPFLALDSGTVGTVNSLAPENAGTLLNEPIYNIHDAITIFVPSPGAGGSIGRQKVSENRKVVPTDRAYFNYSAFSGVPVGFGRNDVHRFVPGAEKTFWNGKMSVEGRIPFAATVDSNISVDGVTNDSEVELGNLTLTLKGLVHETMSTATSIGLTFSLPTADDINVFQEPGQTLLLVENEALHLMPFIGWAYAPNERFFAQLFTQVDIAANSNPVFISDTFTSIAPTGQLSRFGSLHDAAFLYVSGTLGYWMYREPAVVTRRWDGRQYRTVTEYGGSPYFTGFAPLLEIHFNRSLEAGDEIKTGAININSYDTFSLTDVIIGAMVTFGQGGSFRAAYAMPVIGMDDKQFNSEVRLSLAWEK